MSTLVFDIRANHDTGVSRYGLSMLAAAAPLAIAEGWRLITVVNAVQHDRARTAVRGLDTEVLVCPDEDGFVRRSPWLRELVKERRADLYYTSHYTLDTRCAVPYVFTIHDLTRLRFPEFSYSDTAFAERFGASEFELVTAELAELAAWDDPRDSDSVFTRYFWALNRRLAGRAARIAVVSDATARDVQTLLRVNPACIDLVPCGVDTMVFRPQDPAAVQAARERHRLPGPYLVFVGLTHPHKRFPWLIEQLARNKDRFPHGTRLVAIGGHAERVPEVAAVLERYGARDLVAFTGKVTDAELAALYGGAAALVTASLSEGNNLPPLEALATGAQVIATGIPPLRETLGQAASFYDPSDGQALADLAQQALAGRLPDPARLFRPPAWPDSARALVTTLRSTLACHATETKPAG